MIPQIKSLRSQGPLLLSNTCLKFTSLRMVHSFNNDLVSKNPKLFQPLLRPLSQSLKKAALLVSDDGEIGQLAQCRSCL